MNFLTLAFGYCDVLELIMNYVMGKVKTRCAFIFTVTLLFLNGILISFPEYEKIRCSAEGVVEIVHNLPSSLF